MKTQIIAFLAAFGFVLSTAHAMDLKVGDMAPEFKAKTHEGKNFDLASRKGKWTVLYFYPKAGTSGCTAQAKNFRDNIEKIKVEGADVFGISVNTVAEQAKFCKDESLNFTLLADEKGDITKLYGSKMPMINMSKRWTFIIDPELKIAFINRNVNADTDAQDVLKSLVRLKIQSPTK